MSHHRVCCLTNEKPDAFYYTSDIILVNAGLIPVDKFYRAFYSLNSELYWEAKDKWRATVDIDLPGMVDYYFKGNTGIRHLRHHW